MNFGRAPSRIQQLRDAMGARQQAPQQARTGLLPTQRPAPIAPTQSPRPTQQPAPTAPMQSPRPTQRPVLVAPRPQTSPREQELYTRVQAATHPFNSPVANVVKDVVAGRVVMPWDTQARYNEHAAAYDEYRTVRQEYAGNFKGDTFIVNTPQDMGRYNRLQTTAAKVETTGKAFETAQERELFGIPKRVSDANKGLASFLNLPATTPQVEGMTRKATSKALGLAAPFITPALQVRPLQDFLGGTAIGGYERFRTEPLTAGGSVAIGFVGGMALKGATLLPKVGPVVTRYAPTIGRGIEGLYAGSIGVRTGAAGPDPYQMGKEFGGIMTTEAIPMYGGAKAFNIIAPRVSAGIKQARGAYTSYKIRKAPAAQVKAGGWAEPPEEVILEGLKMREGMSTFAPARSLSSRYPKKSGRIVEVGPGKYVDKGLAAEYHAKTSRDLDSYYLREFGVDRSAWRRPIPPEYLAPEDILAAPAHWRTPEFGGAFSPPVKVTKMYGGAKVFKALNIVAPRVSAGIKQARGAYTSYKIRKAPAAQVKAGGWAEPPEEVILEGLKMREGMSTFVPARSLSSRYPKKSGRIVEVGPGKYVDKGLAAEYHAKTSRDLDSYYLREFGVDRSAWRRPIPPEYLAPEDILAAPAHWRTPEFGGAFSPPPVKVTKMYAGIPISIGRQGLRVGKSTYSLSGRPLRVRPPRADLSIGDALTARFALPLASGTRETLASGEIILSRLEPNISSRARSDTLTASGLRDSLASQMGIDTSKIAKSALNLDSPLMSASALRSAQDQDFAQLTTSHLSSRQRQHTGTQLRIRELTISVPYLSRETFALPKVTTPPAAFGLPGDPAPKKKRKKKGKKTEFDEFLRLPDLSSLWRF